MASSSSLRIAPLAVLAAALLLHVPLASAQDREGSAERPARPSSPASITWQPGPAPELWAAPAIGLGVGGLTIALAVVLGQVGSANYHEAIDPATTQLRASQLASTLPDLSLAANILFAVGGGMALIGTTWLIVLPFSQHPVASVQASIGPGGLSLTGSF